MARKMLKQALAVMMALVLCTGFMVSAAPRAFAAAATGSLTVRGQAELADKDVTATRMFSATKSANGSVAYTLENAWEQFFKTGDFGLGSYSGEELSQKAFEYVSGLGEKDSEAVTKFAAKAKAYMAKNTSSFTDLTVTKAAAKGDGDTAMVTFDGLAYGYYLVGFAGGSTSAERHTDAVLVNVLEATNDINMKSEYPTVEKTVSNGGGSIDTGVNDDWESDHNMGVGSLRAGKAGGIHGGDAAVGDVLTFTLKSKVPDMTGYDSYTFKFVDTLSKGLTLLDSVSSPKVTVKIGNTALKSSDFTVTATGGNGAETKLTVDLSAYLTAHKDDSGFAGKTIEVTYQAELNQDAVLVTDPNTNTVHVEYSNDPDSGGTGTSTEDKTYTYTFGFTVNKTDDKDPANPLAGAEFKIWKDNGDNTFSEESDTALTFDKDTDKEGNNYMLHKGEGGSATITTDATGKFMACGLDEGTYWIQEIKAPDGYNKLPEPVKVTITAQYNEDGTIKAEDGHQIKYITADGEKTAAHPNHDIFIENKTGVQLPSTGGMGTVALTVAGVVVVAGGVAWALRRNRANR